MNWKCIGLLCIIIKITAMLACAVPEGFYTGSYSPSYPPQGKDSWNVFQSKEAVLSINDPRIGTATLDDVDGVYYIERKHTDFIDGIIGDWNDNPCEVE